MPRVSVVMPSYRSQQTIAPSLDAVLAQELDGEAFEVIVVDSSPDEQCAEIVARDFPTVRLVRSAERLLPQAARNLGARHASGELLVFTDPDTYAVAGWLRALVTAYDALGGVVVGGLGLHGEGWVARGVHLAKFSKWLPGRRPGAVDMGPTANLLVPRRIFDDIGGFDGDMLLGDVALSWKLLRRGIPLRLLPAAAVLHHEVAPLGAFLRERARRGVRYGELRLDGTGRAKAALQLLLVPPRLVSNPVHTFRHAREAGEGGWALVTAPIVVAAHGAALLGEAFSYARALVGGRAARSR